MQRIRTALCVVGVVFSIASAQAEVRYDLKNPSLAAVVEQSPFTVKSLDMILAKARRQDMRQTRASVLEELVNNRLLALSLTEFDLSVKESVGFQNEETIRNRLSVLARQLYGQDMEAWLESKPEGFAGLVIGHNKQLPKQLEAIFRKSSLLGYHASEEQQQQMKTVNVLQYQFEENAGGSVSLYDLYQSQNIQGKIALTRGDMVFVDKQARLELAERFSLWWLESRSELSPDDVTSLKTAVSDRVARVAVEKKLGLYNVMHSDNKGLRQWIEKVTQDEILEYFQANKEDFIRLTAVKGRHIRLDSQEKADAVYKELKDGLAFSDAVKKYSIADDKTLPQPGDLGWLERTSKTPGWLESVAYMQKVGVVSKPVRSPGDTPFWEIVLVDKQKSGFHNPNSETVRYIAGKEIALEKAKAGYHELLSFLREQYDVQINPEISKNL
ncbi:peptidylprolyl isomerase [Parendozoicomonas sp. Alg238-R29]|uniref:peptidylprolyl isomerase n=1 Tax=Parendozoicomonas sp. Alg238-R29 TaxID=2993446 RepID=UPI00248E7A1E|nr:peptidylprolyl isomerase [Parendozoicomonas sp. Alg238-R29]